MTTDWFVRIRSYYDQGLWAERHVARAVNKGLITQLQADQIISGRPLAD